MAKKKIRQAIKLKSSESTYQYWTVKNPKNTTDRIEVKKYDPIVKKHVAFKEAK
jgi:large subunit ribosomal protein L33